jgi:hypothetical protein
MAKVAFVKHTTSSDILDFNRFLVLTPSHLSASKSPGVATPSTTKGRESPSSRTTASLRMNVCKRGTNIQQ